MLTISFIIYSLFFAIHLYCYLLLAISFFDNFKLSVFNKFTHYIVFFVISTIFAFNSFSFKIHPILPGYISIIGSITWVFVMFIFIKFHCKITWFKTFIGMILFVAFNMLLDSVFLFLVMLLNMNLDAIFTFLQYFGALYYGAVSLSVAMIIHYIRGNQNFQPHTKDTNRAVLPDYFRNNYLLLLIIFVLFLLYQILISINNYTPFSLSIMTFILIFVLIICTFYLQIRFNKKKYQALYVKHLEDETINLANYTKTVDSLYNDIRHYKHDLQNILLGMRLFIDNKNYDALQEFYYSEVLSLSPVSNPTHNIIANLQLLEHVSLKGLIFSKIESIIKNGVLFQVEMMEPIKDVAVSSVDLCRIIGILIDNGIEAARTSEDKELILSINIVEGKTMFVIQNTFDRIPDLDKLYQLNYSTKGNSRGVGLHSLKSIISKYPNIALSYKLEDKFFYHIIEVENS